MSQYSALMVMEKEYGREQMRRFLRYELDRYLRSRGGELIEELPLLRVEDQGYIHYSKGSLAMYALRDAIGEETLNAALRRYVSRVAYQEPPYTYTRELLAELRQAVPPERQGLLEDLFETITLWDNRVRVASAEPIGGGRWQVRLELSARKLRADGHGAESEIPMDDWVDVAVFGEKEPGGPKTGRLLTSEKRRVTDGTHTLELVVDGEPLRAGVDPFHKLIDRDPDDNTVEVKLGGGATVAHVAERFELAPLVRRQVDRLPGRSAALVLFPPAIERRSERRHAPPRGCRRRCRARPDRRADRRAR